jgi:hypothetical protein
VTTDIDAASFLVALLALALSGGAIYYSRRATKASERSAKASECSAEAASRSAGVAEREEQRQAREAEERAVRWKPEAVGTATVRFVNIGDGTAYDVAVEVREGNAIVGGRQVNGATVHSGDSVRVPASTAGLGTHRQFDVHWRTSPEGPVQTRTIDI